MKPYECEIPKKITKFFLCDCGRWLDAHYTIRHNVGDWDRSYESDPEGYCPHCRKLWVQYISHCQVYEDEDIPKKLESNPFLAGEPKKLLEVAGEIIAKKPIAFDELIQFIHLAGELSNLGMDADAIRKMLKDSS